MIVRTPEQAEKIRQRLSDLAYRATKARDKLENELEKMKQRKDWETICELTGMSPDGDYTDWMA